MRLDWQMTVALHRKLAPLISSSMTVAGNLQDDLEKTLDDAAQDAFITGTMTVPWARAVTLQT